MNWKLGGSFGWYKGESFVIIQPTLVEIYNDFIEFFGIKVGKFVISVYMERR